MTEALFVYGTLMDPQIQRKVIGRTVPSRPDRLDGYKKETIQLGGGLFPIVRPAPDSSVEGLLLIVTPAELERIDHYESDAYRRQKIRLAGGQLAWVYRG